MDWTYPVDNVLIPGQNRTASARGFFEDAILLLALAGAIALETRVSGFKSRLLQLTRF